MRGVDFEGFRLISLADVESTNPLARNLAVAGEPEGLVITASRQSRGKGRLDRDWRSPPGNLYCSMILRPRKELSDCASLSLLVALAVRNAIQEAEPTIHPEIKWPNDVLIDGRKTAGILIEGEADADHMCRFLIIGLGLNLRTHPEGLDRPATDLSAHGIELSAHEMLALYLKELRSLYISWHMGGFEAIKRLWMRHMHGVGRNVTVQNGGRTVRGLLAGIDESGNLRLMTANGEERLILSGELNFDEIANNR